MGLAESEKAEIVRKLTECGAANACPRCGNANFILLDGYFNSPLQSNFKNLDLGGPTVPSISTVCNRCGFISMHALGVLGLISKNDLSKD